MTLLSPIAAIVAGAVGGTLLILVYMLRLRRRPVRVSTIMFWTDPPKDLEANIPLRMVRPAWTLLLQAVAVALLAMALGRPAMNVRGSSTDRLYIVIDRSASMNATDGPGGRTRLDEAKTAALQLIDGVGGLTGSRAMVIALGARAEGLSAMTADRGVLAAAVQAIQATDEAGDLAAGLELVSALIASEATDGQRASVARVVLLSDGAFSSAPSRPLAGATLDFQPIGSRAGPRDNVAIAALAAERDNKEPARVRVFVRVVSMRTLPTPVTLVLTIDGEELARRAVVAPGAEENPAEQSISLEYLRGERGVLRAGIDRTDQLLADNEAAVVVPSIRRAAILVVAAVEADPFLVDVLEEVAPGRVRVVSAGDYDTPAGAELVDRSDLVVFDRVHPAVIPDRPTLSFGAGIGSRGLDFVTGPDGSVVLTGETGAATWDRAHPTLADVTLDSLVVSRVGALREGDRRVLASGRDGPLVIEGTEGGHRRIVVAFSLRDSNWPLSVGFPIFLSSALDHLVYGGAPGRAIAFRAGETIATDAVLPDSADGSVVIFDSRGREAARGDSVVLQRAGVYEARGGVARAPLAVNVADEQESRIEVLDRISVSGETVAGTSGVPGPRELWAWFILAAAAVLLVEWIVYLAIARA